MDDLSPTQASSSPPPRPLSALRRAGRYTADRVRAYRHELVILALIATVTLILLLPLIYHAIPSGHVGVLWKRFGGGTLTDEVFPEGSRLTFPWDHLFIYDARVQMVERKVDVLSSDGLKITLVLVWRYRLSPDFAALMHKHIGPNYAESLLAPIVSARARCDRGLPAGRGLHRSPSQDPEPDPGSRRLRFAGEAHSRWQEKRLAAA